MDSFHDYYFEEGIKSYLGNLGDRVANKFRGVKEYSLYLSDLPVLVELSERGFERFVEKVAERVEIADWRKKTAARLDLDKDDPKLRKDYIKRYKLKSEDRIVKMYKGKIKDSSDLIPDDYEPVEVSVYETAVGGIVTAFSMTYPDSGLLKFYAGCDGKGNSFINAILGMSLGTFASMNRTQKAKIGFDGLPNGKAQNYKSDVKADDEDISYLEAMQSVGDAITDKSNPYTYAVMQVNNHQYRFTKNKLSANKIRQVVYHTNFIGTGLQYKLNAEDSVYLFELRSEYSKEIEFLIIYESKVSGKDDSNFKDVYTMYFDRNAKDDIYWVRGLSIKNLPAL